MKPTIQVMYYKGWFDLESPTADMIDHRDIALGLSRQARYNGFTNGYYSVAEHSILVASWLMRTKKNPELAILGLIHDAAEAYIGDMVTPIKQHLPLYKIWEDRIYASCYQALRPNKSHWYGRMSIIVMKELIHEADTRIRIDETKALMSGGALDQWARNNAQELKISHEPLGVKIEAWDYGIAEEKWLNAYAMYRSVLEHGIPS
jgi:hypothetical protein